MFRSMLSLTVAVILAATSPKPARAYDMDCAIMLCMAGGFPPSAVCAAAYREMIRRITPWPVRPPFGICSFAALPVALGGPGGEEDLDISGPEFAWLRKTRVYWWYGSSNNRQDGERRYTWWLRSCDGENRRCRYLGFVLASPRPWPGTFLTDNGQEVPVYGSGRAVMLEYGDFDGVMDHSAWHRY